MLLDCSPRLNGVLPCFEETNRIALWTSSEKTSSLAREKMFS